MFAFLQETRVALWHYEEASDLGFKSTKVGRSYKSQVFKLIARSSKLIHIDQQFKNKRYNVTMTC